MSENGAAGKVLLASATAWPACAKLAIAFLRHGCHVEAVCASGHPFAYVSGIGKMYPYRPCASLQSLKDAVFASDPDLIVPCDDGVVRQFHELYRTVPALREIIERSLGSPESYEIVDSRAMLMRAAAEIGIRTAESVEIESAVDMELWFATHGVSGVLKADDTYAGKGVRIVESPAAAERACAILRRRPGLLTAGLRWHALRDVLGIWRWAHHRSRLITLQRYVRGTPANAMIACRNGNLLGIVTVKVLWSEGETGPAFVVQVIENAEIASTAKRLANHLGLSGFHGFDFIVDTDTGHASLIELNPRCTQLGHLPIRADGDLAGHLCMAMFPGCSVNMQTPTAKSIIAFFPQVLFASCREVNLEDAFIDIPWSDPELVRQLAVGDWRRRRWLARLFHRLRPSVRAVVEVGNLADMSAPSAPFQSLDCSPYLSSQGSNT